MSSRYKNFSSKLFAPVDRRIWARTLNFVDCRRDGIIFRIYVYVTLVLVVSNTLQYQLGIKNTLWIVISRLAVFVISAILLYLGKDLWSKNMVLLFMNISFFISSLI